METLATRRQEATLLPAQTKESLIAAYKNLQTPSSILTNIRCRSFEEVLTSNHPTLEEMACRSKSNTAFVLSYLTAAVISYLDFVGRRQTMDDRQVAETAELILAEYPALKFDDIALFVRLCKLSHFGKLYDLNGAVLLQWLQTYTHERNQARYDLAERKRQEEKEAQERQEEAELANMTNEEIQGMQQKVENLIDRLCKKLKM